MVTIEIKRSHIKGFCLAEMHAQATVHDSLQPVAGGLKGGGIRIHLFFFPTYYMMYEMYHADYLLVFEIRPFSGKTIMCKPYAMHQDTSF